MHVSLERNTVYPRFDVFGIIAAKLSLSHVTSYDMSSYYIRIRLGETTQLGEVIQLERHGVRCGHHSIFL